MPVEELLKQIDIVEYISQYVELEEKNGEWWGISPFTDPPEHTPSFSVRREKNAWFDFSSGRAGNALTFTKYYFGCDGREAYEKLADYLGVDRSQLVARHKLPITTICRQFAPQKTSQKILELIEGNPQITTHEMAAIIGIDRRNIHRNIKKLREQGALCRVGPDKGGHWEIIKEV